MFIDEPELYREADPKMSAASFRISRSIRSRSFSRLSRAFSAARSDADGAGACVLGRLAAPVACAPNGIIHRRSTVSCTPSSRATALADRPLVATCYTASRLNDSGNTLRVPLIEHSSPGSKAQHGCLPKRGRLT